MSKKYIVILQSAWMDSLGCGISYDYDGEVYSTIGRANKHGWKVRSSDDFNIGIVEDEILIDFCNEKGETMLEDEKTMEIIAESLGLEFIPRG